MKIQITFKTPDALDEAIREAVARGLPEGLLGDERQAVMDLRVEKLSDKARAWFTWGEYVTVEWDTEAETCRVVPAKE